MFSVLEYWGGDVCLGKTDISVPEFQDGHLSPSIPRWTSQSQYYDTHISVPVFQDRHPSPSIPRPISQSPYKTNISVPAFQDREHLSSSISRQTSQSQHFKTNISVPVVQDRHLSPSIPRVETNISVPVFDDAIPAGSGHLGCFMGVPEDTDADVVVSLELAVQLGALPVPHIHLAISIPAGNVAGTHRVKKHLLHCPEKNGLSHNSGFSITFFPFF